MVHVEPEELETELAENELPHATGTQSLVKEGKC
jgi:hypothetical protein